MALAASRPVLAFGVVGRPECCLITGYDEGGDVLLGWNFFQGVPPMNAGLAFEPTGRFRKQSWYPDTWSGQRPCDNAAIFGGSRWRWLVGCMVDAQGEPGGDSPARYQGSSMYSAPQRGAFNGGSMGVQWEDLTLM